MQLESNNANPASANNLSDPPIQKKKQSSLSRLVKGFIFLFIFSNVIALVARTLNTAVNPNSTSYTYEQSAVSQQVKETYVDVPSLVGKTYADISKLIGNASQIDEQKPPVFSHYEWNLPEFIVYAESELPNSQSAVSYIEVTIPNKCNSATSMALKLFGLSTTVNPTYGANGVKTWEPFGNYDRVRLWCDGSSQVIKVIPDATVGL